MTERKTFLGIPVITEEDIDAELRLNRPQVLAVTRVTDSIETGHYGPPPALRERRLRTPCEGCGEICWYDPKGYNQIAILRPKILCVRCIVQKLKDDKTDQANTEPGDDMPS